MTEKEIKERLQKHLAIQHSCEVMREHIQSKCDEIERLKATIRCYAKGDRKTLSNIDLAIEQINRSIDRYSKQIMKLEESEQEILQMLERVENANARSVIILHFIDSVRFEDIPDKLSISLRTVWSLYKKAIHQMSDESTFPCREIKLPQYEKRKKNVDIVIATEQLNRLDSLCQDNGIKRSAAIRAAIKKMVSEDKKVIEPLRPLTLDRTVSTNLTEEQIISLNTFCQKHRIDIQPAIRAAIEEMLTKMEEENDEQ